MFLRALRRWWLLPVLLGACSAVFAQAAQPVPAFSARVVDLTATLNTQQRAALEQKLAAFQDRKGSQVAVLVVPTTEPESIEQYATRVFDQWKPGRGKVDGKWVDDGVILLVAKNDRKMRFEVGYGLEGALPDATAKRIIDETVAPLFRQGDFYGGINAGVDQAIRVVDGEVLPPPDQKWQGGGTHIGNSLPILIFVVFGISTILRQFLGRGGGSFATAGVTGLLAWLFSHAIPIALFAGGIAFLFSLLAGGARGNGWTSGGGFGGWGGGLGGGGFGGGGGGFGGGGGGRSGGGGASGGW